MHISLDQKVSDLIGERGPQISKMTGLNLNEIKQFITNKIHKAIGLGISQDESLRVIGDAFHSLSADDCADDEEDGTKFTTTLHMSWGSPKGDEHVDIEDLMLIAASRIRSGFGRSKLTMQGEKTNPTPIDKTAFRVAPPPRE